MKKEGKRIFVTGAAGFVASHMLPLLIENGYEVTALIRNRAEKGKIRWPVKIVIGDLAKSYDWMNSLKNHQVLIHLAAEISSKSPRDFYNNNVLATKNLIIAAKRAKIGKIIHFSSAAVTSIRLDEYASTKKEQEQLIASSKIRSFILRPSMIYGEGDTKNIGWLISLVKRLPIVPLPGGGHFGRQPIYVKDICRITLKLISGDYPSNLYEIHGIQYVTMEKMVKTIIKLGKMKKIIIAIPLFTLIWTFWMAEKLFKNPKFTTDQIKSLTSGEKFSGDKWWKTFDIIPTKFASGVAKMIKDN